MTQDSTLQGSVEDQPLKPVPRWKRIILFSTRLHWQLTLSLMAFGAAALIFRNPKFGGLLRALRDPAEFATVMGVTGGILALASSIAFAHLLSFMTEASARKREAYHRLQERLYELDSFVQTKGQSDEVTDRLLEFSYDLRRLQLKDFPITDWLDRVGPLESFFKTKQKSEAVQVFQAHTLVRLNYCEELVSEIGLASVRQMIITAVAHPLLKSFMVLAALILAGVGGLVFATIDSFAPLVGAIPFFFAVLTALLLVEVGFAIYRETEEAIDFLET